jgi:hypothetical protein
MKKCTGCKEMKELTEFGKELKRLKSKCKVCINKQNADWKQKNLGKNAIMSKEWYKQNKVEYNQRNNETNRLHPEIQKNLKLIKTYGITLDQYEAMELEQNGCCYICKRNKELFARGLCVDHNHNTGEVRKLLCSPCNQGLGLIKENITVAESIIKYLIQFKKVEENGELALQQPEL